MLDHIDSWIFDLDNTLYPASANLFSQIDAKMGAYIQDLLGLDPTEAHRIQKELYHSHGMTLPGLMEHHGESLTWDQWPEFCRTPQAASAFLEELRHGDRKGVESRLGFHAFVQWLCDRQWQALRRHADRRVRPDHTDAPGQELH